MPNNQINRLLEFANFQMASEAFLLREIDNGVLPGNDVIKARLENGNFHASIFTQLQAEKFVNDYQVLAQYRNDSALAGGTGFSGTLFKNKTTGELTLSFRSTEFIDDAVRDGKSTNEFEIKNLWETKGSGLANCIKMFVEGFGESGGLSRACFETGESMTNGSDIAPEGLGEGSKRRSFGLERKPGRERTRFGGQPRPAVGEQLLLAHAVAAAHIRDDFRHRGRAMAGRFDFQNCFNEIFLANDARVGAPAVERLVVPFSLTLIDEARVAGARNVDTGAELPQHPVGGQPGQRLVSEIGPVTAVGVSGSLLDHAGAHRIEMDVAHQRKSVAIPIDEEGLEAAFKEVACAFTPCIDIARIAEGEVLHAGGQGLLARLEGEVQMIGHQAEGMNPVAESTHTILDQFIEPRAVFSAEEDVLTGVPAQDDMVEAAGHVQAGFASHVVMIVERRALCN